MFTLKSKKQGSLLLKKDLDGIYIQHFHHHYKQYALISCDLPPDDEIPCFSKEDASEWGRISPQMMDSAMKEYKPYTKLPIFEVGAGVLGHFSYMLQLMTDDKVYYSDSGEELNGSFMARPWYWLGFGPPLVAQKNAEQVIENMPYNSVVAMSWPRVDILERVEENQEKFAAIIWLQPSYGEGSCNMGYDHEYIQMAYKEFEVHYLGFCESNDRFPNCNTLMILKRKD